MTYRLANAAAQSKLRAGILVESSIYEPAGTVFCGWPPLREG